jgi:hypothetical protein
MSDRRPSLQQRLRPACTVVAGIGAVLSVLAAFVALGAFSLGGLFYTFDYRTGGWAGAVAFLMAMLTVGGAIVVRRSPALGSALLYVGGCGGFLACGGIWLIPGVITLVGANLALWAIVDPFADAPAGRGA